MSRRRILVVEDNPTARKLYRLILQTEGFEVIEAGDAGTALECIERDPPSLILQDLLLPDMNGLDLLKKVREHPAGRELPIVALSGFRSLLEQANVLPLGFDATLVKPVERASLLAAVRSFLPDTSEPPDASGRGRVILLVDDDPVQSKLVRLRFLDAGFEVLSASDGAAALTMATEHMPELILSDVLMPEMDGFELCAAVRGNPKLARVPVVLMSAHFVDAHDAELGRRVGAHSLALRTPGLKEVVDAVCDALSALPPSTRPPEFPKIDHKTRLAHRLKQLATVNATLLQRCAQQAAQLSILGGVADALAQSQNVDAILQDVLAACLDAGGISKGTLFREDANGVMSPEQSVGFTDAERDTLSTTFTDATGLELMASGKPIPLSAFFQKPAMEAFAARAGLTAAVFIPIMVEDHCAAALFLGCGDAELNEEELLTFGRAIGAYVAQALSLASAFQRVSSAAAADRILFSSLDMEKTLRSLGQLVIETMADLCEIDLVEDDGALKSTVIAHADPVKLEWVREMNQRFPPMPERSHRHRVLATKEAFLCSEMTDAMRVAMAQDEGHLELLRAIGLRSHMVVPLLLKGRVLGILSLGTSRPGRRHGTRDLALAVELAGRAAIALENARLYREVNEANRARDEFLATVSHELRTPLNAMLGWTRLLRTGALSPVKTARALETIERNGVAQTQLIADILDVSRIVAGKVQLQVREVSLASVVDSALDSVRLWMDAKAIVYEANLDPGVKLVCDPDRLQQVMWNLLSNAIKFTPAGGAIRVGFVDSPSQVEISVVDSGQGIGTDLLPRIFDRFRQGDGSTTRAHGGLGLGLAIARHIVELHGGGIEASSEGEGKGAVFRVRLPRSLARSSSPALERTTLPPPPPAAPPELSGLRVLAVDDDPDARELLLTILEGCGADVMLAGSTAEAMNRLDESKYDILISDIGMPGRDGISFIRDVRAKAKEHGASIPALALTAYARQEERRAALLAGYQMHLTKPFEPTELVNVTATLARMAMLMR